MHPHHTQSIQRVTEYFQRDPEVLALFLGGSIAHGFETETSDIDIMIFVSDEDYKKRLAEKRHILQRAKAAVVLGNRWFPEFKSRETADSKLILSEGEFTFALGTEKIPY